MSEPAAKRLPEVDDFLDVKVVSDVQVDPPGRRVAFVVAGSTVEKGEPSPVSNIWLLDVDGGDPRQITHGNWTDDLPRWSPDGSMLAFRSDRARRGTGQLYLLRSWGEALPLHQFDAGVTAIHWSPVGDRIAVIAPDAPHGAPGSEAATRREQGDDRVLFEEEHPYGRVWLVDPESGEARCVTDGPFHVWEIAWSPDGASLAAIISDLPYQWSWYRSRLARIDLRDGSVHELYAPERQLTRPAWSPDGRWIAAISSTWSDPGMTGGDLFVVPAGGGEARDLTAGQLRSHFTAHWRPDSGSLVSAALERNRAAVCEVGLDGETETFWRDELAFAAYDMTASASGRVVAAAIAGPTRPAEVYIGRVDGDGPVVWTRRTNFNAPFADLQMAPVETVGWTAKDGTPIEGLLARPLGGASGPVPLVVMIHGGPTSSWSYGLRGGGFGGLVQMLATRGIAVLMPNPRGSTGWGLAFAEANHGDMGGEDLNDILAGVDHCVQAGIADAERLGIAGWSYGGYLTAWAITQTARFRAAIAGASITNWYSFHGGTNIPAFDEIFFGTDPYSLQGPYASRSPIFYVDTARTPTLFLHGEQDPCCPVGQAYEMTRGLRSRGVEAQCVVYPREGHGIRERRHQQDVLERSLAWFVERLSL